MTATGDATSDATVTATVEDIAPDGRTFAEVAESNTRSLDEVMASATLPLCDEMDLSEG